MYCTRLGRVLPLLCVVKCAECCLPATPQGVYAKAAGRCIQKPHVLLEVWGGGGFGAIGAPEPKRLPTQRPKQRPANWIVPTHCQQGCAIACLVKELRSEPAHKSAGH